MFRRCRTKLASPAGDEYDSVAGNVSEASVAGVSVAMTGGSYESAVCDLIASEGDSSYDCDW